MSREFLWYIPNTVLAGHRGDDTVDGWGSLDYSVELALRAEANGFGGALIGTGWGRPDAFTIATAIAARTTTFAPLVAIRPGYWHPAHFASAAATLDQLSRGRLLVNVVTGADDVLAYGDVELDKSSRYERTREFMQLVRRLWQEEDVSFDGQYFSVEHSTLEPRPDGDGPKLYFGGASAAAEEVAAEEADVQLFWGEPLDGIAERIERLKLLSEKLGREHAPLEYGLRITTLVRDTSEEAWRDAEAKVAELAGKPSLSALHNAASAEGQRRLTDLADRGEVLDSCLYTAPSRYGGEGAGTTWLVGSAAEVASALQKYRDLGVSQFILSDTPYLSEVSRIGEQVLPLLRVS
ncbi:LLM class flavin-dependent oxidoreductase [Mycobacterium paraterrae]|uniref:LLM class flavin-dependent oxidoreductase n=1 Tax=Mycobacterium paraterrae TaxID=577492 RepID=A0ABY3VNP9_9MYCO|nr:LLM class flavin-dependent oxidoreductase [Mycobacterium paraterrae]UMB68837.1 LLM class flavin-dependent oxidoreductase [Mycobacterium paraterrae]